MSDPVEDPAETRLERLIRTADGLDPVTGLLPLAVAAVGGVAVVVARLWRRLRRR